MNQRLLDALEHDQIVDITTTGRLSGTKRRKEIWFHNLDGKIYITGIPGRRDWYANLLVNPDFTFHLKRMPNPAVLLGGSSAPPPFLPLRLSLLFLDAQPS